MDDNVRFNPEGFNAGSKLVSSLKWQALFNVFSRIISPVTTLVLIRLLSPADFAAIAILSLVSQYSQYFINMGLNSSLIQKKTIDELNITTAFLANVISGVVIYVLIFLLSGHIAVFFNMPALAGYIDVISLVFIINSFISVPEALLKRTLQFKKISIATVTSVWGYSLMALVLALAGFGVWSIIYASIFYSLIQVVIFWTISEWRPRRFIFSPTAFFELFLFGSGVFLNNVVSLTSNMDTILIGKFLTAPLLGIYNISYQVASMVPTTLIEIINTVIFPTFSRMQDELETIGETYLELVKYSTILGAPIAVGTIFITPEFVRVLMTDKWLTAIPYIQLMCVFFLVNVIGGSLWGPTIMALGQSYRVLRLNFLRLFAVAAFVAAGIYMGGLLGAVVGMVAYNVLFLQVYQLIVNRLIGLKMKDYYRALIPGLSCCLIMIAPLVLYGIFLAAHLSDVPNLVIQVFLAGIVYVVSLRTLYPAELNFILKKIFGNNVRIKALIHV